MSSDPTLQSARARILDGTAIAAELVERIGVEAARLKEAGITPGLAVVLVGGDPASEVYVRSKGRMADSLGFHSAQHTLPEETTEAELLALVGRLNENPLIHGILVQFPVPRHISQRRVVEAIRPEKDVDGLGPLNVGRLSSDGPAHALVPCTPAGCMILIRRALGNDLSGRRAVVVGRSSLVGKPVAQLLLWANCTVTVTHSRTIDLPAVVREAEIVVGAVGRPEMIRGDWIRAGATVIDVGINRVPAPERGEGKTRLVGDVAFAEAAAVADWITPVPKGVGPMTIAMLMANTLIAACRMAGREAPEF